MKKEHRSDIFNQLIEHVLLAYKDKINKNNVIKSIADAPDERFYRQTAFDFIVDKLSSKLQGDHTKNIFISYSWGNPGETDLELRKFLIEFTDKLKRTGLRTSLDLENATFVDNYVKKISDSTKVILIVTPSLSIKMAKHKQYKIRVFDNEPDSNSCASLLTVAIYYSNEKWRFRIECKNEILHEGKDLPDKLVDVIKRMDLPKKEASRPHELLLSHDDDQNLRKKLDKMVMSTDNFEENIKTDGDYPHYVTKEGALILQRMRKNPGDCNWLVAIKQRDAKWPDTIGTEDFIPKNKVGRIVEVDEFYQETTTNPLTPEKYLQLLKQIFQGDDEMSTFLAELRLAYDRAVSKEFIDVFADELNEFYKEKIKEAEANQLKEGYVIPLCTLRAMYNLSECSQCGDEFNTYISRIKMAADFFQYGRACYQSGYENSNNRSLWKSWNSKAYQWYQKAAKLDPKRIYRDYARDTLEHAKESGEFGHRRGKEAEKNGALFYDQAMSYYWYGLRQQSNHQGCRDSIKALYDKICRNLQSSNLDKQDDHKMVMNERQLKKPKKGEHPIETDDTYHYLNNPVKSGVIKILANAITKEQVDSIQDKDKITDIIFKSILSLISKYYNEKASEDKRKILYSSYFSLLDENSEMSKTLYDKKQVLLNLIDWLKESGFCVEKLNPKKDVSDLPLLTVAVPEIVAQHDSSENMQDHIITPAECRKHNDLLIPIVISDSSEKDQTVVYPSKLKYLTSVVSIDPNDPITKHHNFFFMVLKRCHHLPTQFLAFIVDVHKIYEDFVNSMTTGATTSDVTIGIKDHLKKIAFEAHNKGRLEESIKCKKVLAIIDQTMKSNYSPTILLGKVDYFMALLGKVYYFMAIENLYCTKVQQQPRDSQDLSSLKRWQAELLDIKKSPEKEDNQLVKLIGLIKKCEEKVLAKNKELDDLSIDCYEAFCKILQLFQQSQDEYSSYQPCLEKLWDFCTANSEKYKRYLKIKSERLGVKLFADENHSELTPSTDHLVVNRNSWLSWGDYLSHAGKFIKKHEASLHGKSLSFSEYRVEGDGDCGFTVMGVDRAKAVESLHAYKNCATEREIIARELFNSCQLHSHNPATLDPMRFMKDENKNLVLELYKRYQNESTLLEEVCREIRQVLGEKGCKLEDTSEEGITAKIYNIKNKLPISDELRNRFKVLYVKLQSVFNGFTPELYEDYVNSYLDTSSEKLYLGIYSAKLIAENLGYSFYIWGKNKSTGKLQLQDSYIHDHPKNIINTIKSSNHFNFLVQTRDESNQARSKCNPSISTSEDSQVAPKRLKLNMKERRPSEANNLSAQGLFQSTGDEGARRIDQDSEGNFSANVADMGSPP